MEKGSFGASRVSDDKSLSMSSNTNHPFHLTQIQETEFSVPRCCRLGTCHHHDKLNGSAPSFSVLLNGHPDKQGSGMAKNVVGCGNSIPFTFTQWNELQRQSLIYNYMACSVPVPRDLLFPLSPTMESPSMYNVRRSKNVDPDPGRCKRSDGKKWRCSKMAVPCHRYCEHHLVNRSRHNRSRKLVELKNNVKTQKKGSEEQSLLFNVNTNQSVSAELSRKGTDRDFKHHKSQQREHLAEADKGVKADSSSVYGYSAPDLNADYMVSFPYTTFSAPETECPAGFINAWSVDDLESTKSGMNAQAFVSPNVGYSSPSLTLSMGVAACNELDKEMGDFQMESRGRDNVDHNTDNLRLLTHDSWEPFARGGPLGEVLHSGSPASSPYDSIISSLPPTNVSSPSGVLHKTLFSQSDSSVCNSPTLAAPPSEITFQWFNRD